MDTLLDFSLDFSGLSSGAEGTWEEFWVWDCSVEPYPVASCLLQLNEEESSKEEGAGFSCISWHKQWYLVGRCSLNLSPWFTVCTVMTLFAVLPTTGRAFSTDSCLT